MIALAIDAPWSQRFDPRDPGHWVRGFGDATLADGSYLYYWENTASMRWFWETVWEGEWQRQGWHSQGQGRGGGWQGQGQAWQGWAYATKPPLLIIS